MFAVEDIIPYVLAEEDVCLFRHPNVEYICLLGVYFPLLGKYVDPQILKMKEPEGKLGSSIFHLSLYAAM